MTRNFFRLVAATAFGITLAAGSWMPATAEASHKSFRYTGHYYGFPGEAEMLSALTHMDAAAGAPCRVTRMAAVNAARRDVLHAHRQLSCPHAKRELIRAVGPLSIFGATGDYYRLEESSQRIVQALQTERLVHAQYRHAPQRYVARPDYHGHHDHRGHQGRPGDHPRHGYQDLSGYAVPTAVDSAPATYASQPMIQIGGRRFSIGIGF